ncbi:hypothetical protein ACWT_5031 [Actinoplanes sp. SE50]|nr:hypothetical protein ACPL_5161 [Actinoplanes sp. SE50/110]ATO84446.1 hypothetical protein ACWT_5031 [Actinoplanes sp. SE50]SLM01856.1 hypothetical protein ACSP50_5094 [Actinoplanes sp. SE50/110]
MTFWGWARVLGGPVLVFAVLVGIAFYQGNPPASLNGCTARPDTVHAITEDPVLRQHPHATDLDDAVEESMTCGGGGAGLEMPAADVVGAHLSGLASSGTVRAFYADLAQRSGWQPDKRTAGLFSATKPAGGCPWWFVLSAAAGGYHLRVFYQPDGAPADSCAWKTGDAIIFPVTGA